MNMSNPIDQICVYIYNPDWKLTMPSFEKVSKSFGIKYLKIKNYNSFLKNQKKLINFKGPLVCEIIVDENNIHQ